MLCNHPAPTRAVCPAAPSPPCKCHSPAAALLGDETLMSHHKSGANSRKRTNLAYQGVFFLVSSKAPFPALGWKALLLQLLQECNGEGDPP